METYAASFTGSPITTHSMSAFMAGAEGLEPATAGFGNQCSAN